MVAGFNQYLGLDEEDDAVNCTMYTNRANEFVNLCKERICFYSKNDPYVKIEKLEEFVKLVSAKPICVENAGHFNKSAGYTTFEEILNYV